MWSQRLGYGHPGGVFPAAGRIEVARRSDGVPLADRGTRVLLDPALEPVRGGPALGWYRQVQQFQHLGVEWAPGDLMQQLNYQGYVASSPATLDPTIGARVAHNGDTLLYADDTVVHWLKDDEVIDSADYGSPVLAVSSNMCRTRRGVLRLSGELLYPGDVMDAAVAEKAAVLTAMGDLHILDADGTDIHTHQPRGSKQGWGRVAWTSEPVLLWANRRMSAFLDPRAPNERTVVYDFARSVHEIMDVHAMDQQNALVLTSTELAWIDMRTRKPLLAWDHAYAGDYSLRISACTQDAALRVFVTSQLRPYYTAYTFGPAPTGPETGVSLLDPFLVEGWPTVLPQSCAPIASSDGVDFYVTTAEGGLYKQVLGQGPPAEGYSTIPPVSEPEPLREFAEQRDYDFSVVPDNEAVLAFDNMYHYVADLERPRLNEPQKLADPSVLKQMGFSPKSFGEYCEKIWIAPLQDQRLVARRRAAIELIAADLASYDTAEPEIEIELPAQIQKMSDEWDENEAASPSATQPDDISSQSATQPFATQPVATEPFATQPPALAMPSFSTIAFSSSQPLPAKKKKAKKRKRTDGFG